MDVVTKFHLCGFIMEQLLYIKQDISISNSRLQNHFRWNFSPNSQQGRLWTSQINNQMSDIDKKLSGLFAHQNRSQNILQKSEITHRPSQSINVPIKPPSTPHHPPGGAPGPGRSEGQARQDETILHGWHGAKKVVILFCQKMRISLAYEGKIFLAMRNQTIQRTKIEFTEGWQTRGT